MKYLSLTLATITLVVVLLWKGCEEKTETPLIDNSLFKEKVEKLNLELIVLKASNDSLTISYKEAKERKDSVVYRTKLSYITLYDTIRCLPKPQVDSLVSTYENVIKVADTLILTKNVIIDNLINQNSLKDTIIINHEINEKNLKTALKKEKPKKWLFGLGGAGLGYLLGKAF